MVVPPPARPSPPPAGTALSPPTGAEAQIFRRLLADCCRSPWLLGTGLLATVAAGGAQLGLTWVAKQWVEGPLLKDSPPAVHRLVTAGAAGVALLVVALFAGRVLLAAADQRLLARLREAALARLLAVEVKTVRGFHSGELLSRVLHDAGQLSGFVVNILKRLLGEGLVAAGALAMMFALDWRLALAAGAVVPLVAWPVDRFGRALRLRGEAARQQLARLTEIFHEQLRGWTTVKGYGAEPIERRRFASASDACRSAAVAMERWSGLMIAVVWLMTGLLLLASIAYGSREVQAGHATPGALLAFCLYAAQVAEPLRRLSEVQGLLQPTLAAAARVYQVIDLPGVERDGRTALPRPWRGDLRLEAVDFRHLPERPLLEGLELTLHAGRAAALVAGSGGGKSTLAALLLRFDRPQGGRILLDGHDLQELRLADVRRAVCVVEQEPAVWSGTLGDNLRYGMSGASAEVLAAAARLVGLDRLPRFAPGLATPIAEGGRTLSGGERQRIALGRAIVRDPALLVLDEATSALDGDAEAEILDDLAPWLARRTVLTLAHRLSTVARCSRILVLHHGRIAGDGSLPELLAGCPAFVELFADQLAAAGVTKAPPVPHPVVGARLDERRDAPYARLASTRFEKS